MSERALETHQEAEMTPDDHTVPAPALESIGNASEKALLGWSGP